MAETPRSTASVIIPARDEAAVIDVLVRECLAVEGIVEVIVIDDASRDETALIAARAGAHVIRCDRNVGKGAAMRRGAAAAIGEVLVLIDGDGQDPPHEIPRLLAAIARGADLAIGSRFLGTFEPGAITAIDHVGNRLLSWAFDRLFRVRLTDTQAGFRAIRRALFERLPLAADRFEIETEVLARSLHAGARVVEVAVTRRARAHGSSRLSRVSDGLRILTCMLRMRMPPNQAVGDLRRQARQTCQDTGDR